METFADVSPGVVMVLVDRMRQRAQGRGRRNGTLNDLRALTGRVSGRIVLDDDWTGPTTE